MGTAGKYEMYLLESALEEDEAQNMLLDNGFKKCGSGATHECYIKGSCDSYWLGVNWTKKLMSMETQDPCSELEYYDLCDDIQEWEDDHPIVEDKGWMSKTTQQQNQRGSRYEDRSQRG